MVCLESSSSAVRYQGRRTVTREIPLKKCPQIYLEIISKHSFSSNFQLQRTFFDRRCDPLVLPKGGVIPLEDEVRRVRFLVGVADEPAGDVSMLPEIALPLQFLYQPLNL